MRTSKGVPIGAFAGQSRPAGPIMCECLRGCACRACLAPAGLGKGKGEGNVKSKGEHKFVSHTSTDKKEVKVARAGAAVGAGKTAPNGKAKGQGKSEPPSLIKGNVDGKRSHKKGSGKGKKTRADTSKDKSNSKAKGESKEGLSSNTHRLLESRESGGSSQSLAEAGHASSLEESDGAPATSPKAGMQKWQARTPSKESTVHDPSSPMSTTATGRKWLSSPGMASLSASSLWASPDIESGSKPILPKEPAPTWQVNQAAVQEPNQPPRDSSDSETPEPRPGSSDARPASPKDSESSPARWIWGGVGEQRLKKANYVRASSCSTRTAGQAGQHMSEYAGATHPHRISRNHQD